VPVAGFTVTLTCALAQQHWNPPPPDPIESLPSSRRRYSPGVLKVAVAVDLPFASRSIAGFGLSNFTSPGPRNFVQVIAIGFDELIALDVQPRLVNAGARVPGAVFADPDDCTAKHAPAGIASSVVMRPRSEM
jgi:hypothetical protein